MAEPTDGYNFQAPQFIESLSEVKLDDGADTFFGKIITVFFVSLQNSSQHILFFYSI